MIYKVTEGYRILIRCTKKAGQYEALLFQQGCCFGINHWVLRDKADTKISFDHLIITIGESKKQHQIPDEQITDETIMKF